LENDQNPNYYTTREKKLKKKQSMIALCGKLLRVIITKNKEYDAVKLLEDIKRSELKVA